MEGNHVSWLYPARADAPQGRQLTDAGPRIRLRFRLLTRDLFRIQPSLVAVPVLVVTATATSAFELRDFGPLRVLRKPVALARLVKAARAMLAGTDADSQSEE